MEENNSSKKMALISGLVLGLVLIVYNLLQDLLNIEGNILSGMVFFFLIVFGIYFLHGRYKKDNDGLMSYKKGFGMAMLMVLIAGVINFIYAYLMYAVIKPSLVQEMYEETLTIYENAGMDDQTMEIMVSTMDMVINPLGLALSTFFGLLFWGLILSLIITAFTKQNPEGEF